MRALRPYVPDMHGGNLDSSLLSKDVEAGLSGWEPKSWIHSLVRGIWNS